ncbi:hypothetical protein GWI33_017125 [Rhynchophorus ferrugineus]|uniref:Uncharacterized protein n=1 Tax=Rhynchophorus ferrugineus TaxID=354439 RepID=A0A834HXB6_RHYFE|nr:hypothetical protein GWI33_017125 [Rhynchophorus ferrugineus]
MSFSLVGRSFLPPSRLSLRDILADDDGELEFKRLDWWDLLVSDFAKGEIRKNRFLKCRLLFMGFVKGEWET